MKTRIKKIAARIFLSPFQFMYWGITETRNFLYEKEILKVSRLNFPVISIGNLSVGGTGKTETARYLIELFLDLGLRPAYLSRGYKRSSKGYVRVLADQSTAKEAGDEALMIAKSFPKIPVAVCEDRTEGALQLQKEVPFDVLILDDAFQHRKIHRNLNILTINARKLPWKDDVLPVGRLRESFKNYRRADIVFLNKLTPEILLQGKKLLGEAEKNSAIDAFYHKMKRKLKNVPLILTRYQTRQLKPLSSSLPDLQMDDLKGRTAILFSGIADIESFKNLLITNGAYLGRVYDFPDHYHFSPKNLKRIVRKWERMSKISNLTKEPIIITTEKDIARIWNNKELNELLQNYPVYYLKIELNLLKGNEILHSILFDKLQIGKTAKKVRKRPKVY